MGCERTKSVGCLCGECMHLAATLALRAYAKKTAELELLRSQVRAVVERVMNGGVSVDEGTLMLRGVVDVE